MADLLEVEMDEEVIACTYAGVDLTSFTSITLVLERPDGTVLERTATIDDAAGGLFHFQLQSGDLQVGNTLGELRFLTTGGKTTRLPKKDPFRIYAREKLA